MGTPRWMAAGYCDGYAIGAHGRTTAAEVRGLLDWSLRRTAASSVS